MTTTRDRNLYSTVCPYRPWLCHSSDDTLLAALFKPPPLGYRPTHDTTASPAVPRRHGAPLEKTDAVPAGSVGTHRRHVGGGRQRMRGNACEPTSAGRAPRPRRHALVAHGPEGSAARAVTPCTGRRARGRATARSASTRASPRRSLGTSGSCRRVQPPIAAAPRRPRVLVPRGSGRGRHPDRGGGLQAATGTRRCPIVRSAASPAGRDLQLARALPADSGRQAP